MASLPGSCGYPILGDKSIEFYRDPERFISSRLAETSSKLFQSRLLNQKTVFICSFEGSRQLLEEKHQDFEHGYRDFLYNSYGDNILFENGDVAAHLKKCMLPIFTDISLHNETIRKTCDEFFDTFSRSADSVNNIYEEFKVLMTKLCLELFLGFSDTTDETSKSVANLATLHWHGIISMPLNIKIPLAGDSGWRKALAAKEQLLNRIRNRMEYESGQNHSTKKPKSFLRSLLEAPFKNRAVDIEQHILLFVSALIPKAFSSIISSFILEMAGEKQQTMRERALREEEYHKMVLLEVQRLWPPFFGGRRIAIRDTVITGFKVPKGYATIYVSHFAHRDNTVFSEPDKFNPDRWLGTEDPTASSKIFTYGLGPRQCIGHHLIQYILLYTTRLLLENFDWYLDTDDDFSYKMLPVSRPEHFPEVHFKKK